VWDDADPIISPYPTAISKIDAGTTFPANAASLDPYSASLNAQGGTPP
jgi:hypothetical protein